MEENRRTTDGEGTRWERRYGRRVGAIGTEEDGGRAEVGLEAGARAMGKPEEIVRGRWI